MFATNYLGVPVKVQFDHIRRLFMDEAEPRPATVAVISIQINNRWVEIAQGSCIVHPNDLRHGVWSKASGRKIALARALVNGKHEFCQSRVFRRHIWREYFGKLGKVS